jgi:OmpA-OmpF porin, OOP family
LFQTTTRLKTQDRRDLPFEQQLGAIMAGVDALRSEATLARRSDEEKSAVIERMRDRLAEVEGRAQQFRHEQQRLSSENRFNELFFQAQSLFQPHEAVVVRQPDQMVIRLTGLRFPVGRAAVRAADHGLLRKVQQAILLFDAPEVIVQGYTDSSGDAQTNVALSEKRAEAVMQFLAGNIAVPMLKISAAGHGAALPIASNESAEGRALNRRIEVVIKP